MSKTIKHEYQHTKETDHPSHAFIGHLLLQHLSKQHKPIKNPDERLGDLKLVYHGVKEDFERKDLSQHEAHMFQQAAYEVLAAVEVTLVYVKDEGKNRKRQRSSGYGGPDGEDEDDDDDNGGGRRRRRKRPAGPKGGKARRLPSSKADEERAALLGLSSSFVSAQGELHLSPETAEENEDETPETDHEELEEAAEEPGEMRPIHFEDLRPVLQTMPVYQQIQRVLAVEMLQPNQNGFRQNALTFLKAQIDHGGLSAHDHLLATAAYEALQDNAFMHTLSAHVSDARNGISSPSVLLQSLPQALSVAEDKLEADLMQRQQEHSDTPEFNAEMQQTLPLAAAEAQHVPATPTVSSQLAAAAMNNVHDTAMSTLPAGQRVIASTLVSPEIEGPADSSALNAKQFAHYQNVSPRDLALQAFRDNATDSTMPQEYETHAHMDMAHHHQPAFAHQTHAKNPFYLGGGGMHLNAPAPNFSDPAFGGSGISGSAEIASELSSGSN